MDWHENRIAEAVRRRGIRARLGASDMGTVGGANENVWGGVDDGFRKS